MQNIEEKLILFFEQAAQKDERVLRKLKQKKYFFVKRDSFCFTLPNLHLFLKEHDNIFHKINYKQFRKLIFNSNINQILKLYGAQINIKDNNEKVDNSSYNLTWSDV